MKAIMAVGEYSFAIIFGVFIFLWLMICMLAELPGLSRYLRISQM